MNTTIGMAKEVMVMEVINTYQEDGQKVAKKMIKKYRLNNNSSVLDVGCGKGFLLFEMKNILPGLRVSGFDVSRHGIKNSKKEIKSTCFYMTLQKSFLLKAILLI